MTRTITVPVAEFCRRLEFARRKRHRAFMRDYLTPDDRHVIAEWTGNVGGHYLFVNHASAGRRRQKIEDCMCSGPEHRRSCPHYIEEIHYRK